MRRLLFFLAFSVLAFGQTQTKLNPDCDIPFSFTAAGQRSQITGCGQNTQGVTFWHLIYRSVGWGAISMIVQTAPDNSGVPGAWSTFAPLTGVNPAISITGVLADATFSGYAPWVSVLLNTATVSGTITGHLYGCRTPGCGGGGGGGGGGGATQNVNVTQWDGTGLGAPSNYGVSPGAVKVPGVNAATAADNSSGAAVQDFICDQQVAISISAASGLQAIISGTAAKQIRICHIDFSSSIGSNVEIETGTTTSTPCDTGTAALSGVYQNVLTFSMDYTTRATPIAPSGANVCLNFTNTVTTGGLVTYAIF
jgi:hypothetical protein